MSLNFFEKWAGSQRKMIKNLKLELEFALEFHYTNHNESNQSDWNTLIALPVICVKKSNPNCNDYGPVILIMLAWLS